MLPRHRRLMLLVAVATIVVAGVVLRSRVGAEPSPPSVPPSPSGPPRPPQPSAPPLLASAGPNNAPPSANTPGATPPPTAEPTADPQVALSPTSGAPTVAAAPALPPHPELPPERRALQIVDGQARIVDAEEAVRAGLTLIDLTDEWTPYLFLEFRAADGTAMTNRYRQIYLGLANDTSDGDGQPLAPGQHNYLEVFGIPPSLSVLRERFLADAPESDPCKDIAYDVLKAVKSVPVREGKNEVAARERAEALIRRVDARLKALAPDAKPDAKLAAEIEAANKARAHRSAFGEAERRLACEKLFPNPKDRKHTPGRFDEAMQSALQRFQLKNKLYDAPVLRPETLKTLGRTPLENDYQALVRTLTERVVAAANILEDGTAVSDERKTRGQAPLWRDSRGQMVPVRDLVSEAVQATLAQLDLGSPDKALAFFRAHPKDDFQWLRAAVKLPPVPEYHTEHMDLSIEIDRGDVIYDPPFDEKGRPSPFSRRVFPSLVVHAKHDGQRIPLVKWRTTIGGWRADQAPNGYEYFRYKGSDVGPRAWRNIVAGPVWIAPNSTPIRSLVKWKTVNGVSQQVVNYDELGPGYLSAYGLVVAYNIEPGRNGQPDGDNGVRVHGSSEYRSIRNPEGYSHGCHRLMNHLAVRLFSFVLRHRHGTVDGEKRLGHRRQFLWKDDVFELRLPTRGFWFTLDPPLPVNVLEGNIIGRVKRPIGGYVPKPGVKYPPGPVPSPSDGPEGRAGGGE